MNVSIWVIVSWVLVLALTGLNIFIFLKLKQASEQMMKMAFPSAKNMGDAVNQMQKMTSGFGGMGGGGMRSPMMGAPGPAGRGNPQQMQAQLQAAMKMLQQMQNNNGGGGGKKRR